MTTLTAALREVAMADDSYPKYEAKPRQDGSGYVIVTPREHRTPFVFQGFVSEVEARDWIHEDMSAQGDSLEKNQGNASPFIAS